ncbi:MAG: hypothetical protein K6A89_02600 [Treponema sp.]|nr:hypothetical protein [Treponema sp.]
MKTFILISCCKTKLSHSAPAEELYQSAGFKKSLAYAKSLKPDGIFILSALHHLVKPDTLLEPYNVCLNNFTSNQKKAWAVIVSSQLAKEIDIKNANFIILAGKNYYSNLIPYLNNYSLPLKGLGLGKRLQWLDEHTNTTDSQCVSIHKFFNSLPRFTYKFDPEEIPENGVYVFFEKGEKFHDMDRIVRVGTHTGEGRLVSRLQEHLCGCNKDRSIFRKNIGRAILNKNNDPFLAKWNLDLTSKKNINKYFATIEEQDLPYQFIIEQQVSKYMNENLSFAVISVDDKKERLDYESYLIHTISADKSCKQSEYWLGNYSPVKKIRESGMWLVNELTIPPKKEELRPYKKTGCSISDKYKGLFIELINQNLKSVTYTYEQINELIYPHTLPVSAYSHRQWWANSAESHSHATAWLEAGFKVSKVTCKFVIFEKL